MMPCDRLDFVPLAIQHGLRMEPYGSRDDAGAMLCPACLVVLRLVVVRGVKGRETRCDACRRWAVESPIITAAGQRGMVVYSGFADVTPPPNSGWSATTTRAAMSENTGETPDKPQVDLGDLPAARWLTLPRCRMVRWAGPAQRMVAGGFDSRPLP